MSDLRALVLGAGGQLGRACMESVPEQSQGYIDEIKAEFGRRAQGSY